MTMNIIKKYWHLLLATGIFIVEALVFFMLRENIYVGILDNLDLFITQLKMLRDNDAFFAHGQMMPILQSIDRDYFPSEFSLYNLLFFLLPDLYAYIVGYLLKLLMAFFSCRLLAKLILGDKYADYDRIVTLVSIAFALLPVYPMYAFCFASIPFVLYLFIRLYAEVKLAGAYRKSFAKYTEATLLCSSFYYGLCATFLIGIFLLKYRIEYIVAIPALFFLFCYYLYIAYKPDSAAQKPEKLFREKKLMLLVGVLVILFAVLTFVDIPVMDVWENAFFIPTGR